MKVICSWCESEGRPAVVREKAPLADGAKPMVFVPATSSKWVSGGIHSCLVTKRDCCHGMSPWSPADELNPLPRCYDDLR